MGLNLISREWFSNVDLLAKHKANWVHEFKKLIVEKAGKASFGGVVVSRWEAMNLGSHMPENITQNVGKSGYFDYLSSTETEIQWYLNFANKEIFVGYGDGLLAQDEIQCLEHPILGNLREALVDSWISRPLTVEYHQPTPILITGVERRCHLDTTGIYGRAFIKATPEKILNATTVINPPTISNIISMEAPFGRGPYQRGQIQYILTTAVTGFSAAVQESKERPVSIHTGFWGCGAYGGNLELMALLQILAARAAGVSKLVFHFGNERRPYQRALKFAEELEGVLSWYEIISAVRARNYVWGMSNGT